MQQMILGIDVSKDTLSIFNALTKDSCTIENTPEAIISFIHDFQELFAKTNKWTVGIESTGDYSLLAVRLFSEAGFTLRFLNPVITKKYIKATIREKKTDESDAILIAQAVNNGEGDIIDLATFIPEQKRVALRTERTISGITRSLKLVRQSIQKKQKSLIKEDTESLSFESILTILDSLLQSCKQAQEELIQVATNEGQSHQEKLIDSIPGFATKLAAIVSTELGDIRRFRGSSQLRAFIGLDPKMRQSGNMNYTAGMSKHGNPMLRSALYLAAQTAYRHDPKLNSIYHQKKEQGKNHVHCVNIIASKLCERIYSVIQNNRTYIIPPSSEVNMRAILTETTPTKLLY